MKETERPNAFLAKIQTQNYLITRLKWQSNVRKWGGSIQALLGWSLEHQTLDLSHLASLAGMHPVVEARRLVRAHSALEHWGRSQEAGRVLPPGTHAGCRGRAGGRGHAVCTAKRERREKERAITNDSTNIQSTGTMQATLQVKGKVMTPA